MSEASVLKAVKNDLDAAVALAETAWYEEHAEARRIVRIVGAEAAQQAYEAQYAKGAAEARRIGADTAEAKWLEQTRDDLERTCRNAVWDWANQFPDEARLLGIAFDPTRTTLVCRTCGSADVLQDAWVDPTTGEVQSTFDNFFCTDCDGETSVVRRSAELPMGEASATVK